MPRGFAIPFVRQETHSCVVPFVQAFPLLRGDQLRSLHLLKYGLSRTHVLPRSVRRRRTDDRINRIPVPGYAGVGSRELCYLLLPGTQLAQLTFTVSEHAVVPTVYVANVFPIRRIKDGELFVIGYILRPGRFPPGVELIL